MSGATACVTQKVIDQVNRAGATQMQIALSGVPGGTKHGRVLIRFRVGDLNYLLVVGDSHAAWRSHQTAESEDAFERMFALLADTPGQRIAISDLAQVAQ